MQKLIPLLTQAGERPNILKGTVLDFSEKQQGYQGSGAEWVSGSVVEAVVRAVAVGQDLPGPAEVWLSV